MTRLVLHVGLPKTGTTAFQHFAWTNRRELAGHGLRYCDVLRGPNHVQLAVAFSGATGRLARAVGVADDADRARLRQRLAQRLRTAAPRAEGWIASSELIGSTVRRPDQIAALAGFLHDVFDDVQVVVALRRADYWLPSSYVEAVKAGIHQPLDDGFVHRRRHLLDHVRFARRWAAAFGRDNVSAVPFLETDKANPAALPGRLLGAVGVPEDATSHWQAAPALRNESPSAYATEVLRLLNPRLPRSPLRPTRSRRRALAYVSNRWPGPGTALTPDAAEGLERRGWIHTGIGDTTYAVGADWDLWPKQPPAPTAPLPVIAAEDLATAADALHGSSILHAPWARPAAEAARRWLISVARR